MRALTRIREPASSKVVPERVQQNNDGLNTAGPIRVP